MSVPSLNSHQGQSAIDALCRHWMVMEPGDAADALINLLLQASHAPSDPAERALFWMLSGQFDRYQELDLDGSLLAQAQAVTNPRVRKRLAEKAAEAGRVEWLRAMQIAKSLDQFSINDWNTTVRLLQQAGDPIAMWQWALQMPPVYVPDLLRSILDVKPLPSQLVQVQPVLDSIAALLPEVSALLPMSEYQCIRTFTGHSLMVCSIRWSPDDCLLAVGCDDSTILLLNTISGEYTKVHDDSNVNHQSMSWAPDGSILAYGSWDNREVWLCNPVNTTYNWSLSGHTGNVTCVAWSPDGHFLASGSSDGTIRLWDPTRYSCIQIFASNNYHISAMAWAPDGRHLAYRGEDKELKLLDIQSGMSARPLSDKALSALAWSPDSQFFACSIAGDIVQIWDRSSGVLLHSLTGHAGTVTAIAWSPDSQFLASGSSDLTIRIWDLSTGSCYKLFTGHQTTIHSLSWSPHGTYLASGSYDISIRIWSLTTDSCTHILSGHTHEVRSVAWSPSGRCIASLSYDRTIKLWILGLGDLLTTPLKYYSSDQWSFCSARHKQPTMLVDWQPWLDLILALSSEVRKFDVGIDEGHEPIADSYQIEIND